MGEADAGAAAWPKRTLGSLPACGSIIPSAPFAPSHSRPLPSSLALVRDHRSCPHPQARGLQPDRSSSVMQAGAHQTRGTSIGSPITNGVARQKQGAVAPTRTRSWREATTGQPISRSTQRHRPNVRKESSVPVLRQAPLPWIAWADRLVGCYTLSEEIYPGRDRAYRSTGTASQHPSPHRARARAAPCPTSYPVARRRLPGSSSILSSFTNHPPSRTSIPAGRMARGRQGGCGGMH
jgi:hypothetical protein